MTHEACCMPFCLFACPHPRIRSHAPMREYARLRMLQVFRAMTNLFLAFMMMLGTPRRMVLKPAKKRNWQIRRIRSTRVHALHAPRTAAKRAIFSEDSAQLFLCVVVSVGLFVPRLLRFLSDQTWGHTVLLLGQVIATLLVLWLSVQVIIPLPSRPRMHPNARGPMQCALPNAMQRRNGAVAPLMSPLTLSSLLSALASLPPPLGAGPPRLWLAVVLAAARPADRAARPPRAAGDATPLLPSG